MMTMLSRRAFLKVSGLVLSTSFFQQAIKTLPFARQVRVISPSAIYQSRSVQSVIQRRVWPDEVLPVQRVINDDWLQSSVGFVPMTAIQPMLKPVPSLQIHRLEQAAWVEVVAPYAALRQYANAQAPLQKRLQHGAVILVDYGLYNDDGYLWLRADDGWVQATHLQYLPKIKPHRGRDYVLRLNHVQQQIEIVQNQHIHAKIDANLPLKLPNRLEIVDMHPCRASAKLWHIQCTHDWEIFGQSLHKDSAAALREDNAQRVVLSSIAARWLYYQIKKYNIGMVLQM